MDERAGKIDLKNRGRWKKGYHRERREREKHRGTEKEPKFFQVRSRAAVRGLKVLEMLIGQDRRNQKPHAQSERGKRAELAGEKQHGNREQLFERRKDQAAENGVGGTLEKRSGGTAGDGNTGLFVGGQIVAAGKERRKMQGGG